VWSPNNHLIYGMDQFHLQAADLAIRRNWRLEQTVVWRYHIRKTRDRITEE
jgi:hypothetical protein